MLDNTNTLAQRKSELETQLADIQRITALKITELKSEIDQLTRQCDLAKTRDIITEYLDVDSGPRRWQIKRREHMNDESPPRGGGFREIDTTVYGNFFGTRDSLKKALIALAFKEAQTRLAEGKKSAKYTGRIDHEREGHLACDIERSYYCLFYEAFETTTKEVL